MEQLLNLSPAQAVLFLTLIAGTTELTARARARDWWVVVTIVTSAVVGMLFALYLKFDPVVGLGAGLAASGAIKVVNSFGNKSVPAPSKPVEEK